MKTFKAHLYRPCTGSACMYEWQADDIEDAVEKLKELMAGWFFKEILELAADAMDAAADEIDRLQKENARLYGILNPFACDCETHCKEFSYGCDNWLAQKALEVRDERRNETKD